MTRVLRRIGWTILIVVLLVGLAAFWQRDRIGRLMAVNSLFNEDRIVSNFSHMDAAFLTAPVPRGAGPASPLPDGPLQPLPEGAGQWIKDRAVTAIVVLKDGQLVYEDYFLGTRPEDLRISWSVAKSFLSALVGIELAEGKIASLDDPVTKYAPQLIGSAYDGATLKHVLTMTSGVHFDEDYLNYNSDINKMGRALALGRSMNGFAADLKTRDQTPGEAWAYVSIDTHVVGMVVEGASGRTIADLLSEKIVAPMGLEAAPYYITDGTGTAFVLGGLNLRTRDYARFGQMVLQDGMWNGVQVVPADWIATSTEALAPTAPGAEGYGYQWWIPADARPGEVFARGVYGQYIWIDRATRTVIAVNSADRGFEEPGAHQSMLAMFRRIADDSS